MNLKRHLPLVLILGLFTLIAILNGWLSDDCYISFRQVRNFASGQGITWNLGERVQTFTCPLWIIIFTPFYYLTGEEFWTCFFLQYLLGVILFFQLYRRTLNTTIFLTLSGILLLSSGFTDYLSSGTESPLSLLLTTLWFFDRKKNLGSLWAGLLILTRLDLILIVAPWVLLKMTRRNMNLKELCFLVIPSSVWMVFSLFYFGLPLPSTFYAKITNDISFLTKLSNGIATLLVSFEYDPLFFAVFLLGAILLFIKRQVHLVGAFFYLSYLLLVGGDFMACRLLCPSFLVIVLCFQDSTFLRDLKLPSTGFILSGFLLLSFFGVKMPLLPPFDKGELESGKHLLKEGVADEKAFYIAMGNSSWRRLFHNEVSVFELNKKNLRANGAKDVEVNFIVGMASFFSHPNKYFIEPSGIGSPYMIYLPTIKNPRQGHYFKRVPESFITYFSEGIPPEDPQLRGYLEKWMIVLKGEFFSWERFKAIYELNILYPYKENLSRIWQDKKAFKKGPGIGMERLIIKGI